MCLGAPGWGGAVHGRSCADRGRRRRTRAAHGDLVPRGQIATTTRGLAAFGVGEAQQALLSAWLADAPSDCVRSEAVDNEAIEPAASLHPLVVLSHCHECVRFGPARIAERLASHGFIVAAPDRVGATAFEGEDGTSTASTRTRCSGGSTTWWAPSTRCAGLEEGARRGRGSRWAWRRRGSVCWPQLRGRHGGGRRPGAARGGGRRDPRGPRGSRLASIPPTSSG